MQSLNFLKQERMSSLMNKNAGKIGKDVFVGATTKKWDAQEESKKAHSK